MSSGGGDFHQKSKEAFDPEELEFRRPSSFEDEERELMFPSTLANLRRGKSTSPTSTLRRDQNSCLNRSKSSPNATLKSRPSSTSSTSSVQSSRRPSSTSNSSSVQSSKNGEIKDLRSIQRSHRSLADDEEVSTASILIF